MYNYGRDAGLNYIEARKGKLGYGMGALLLEGTSMTPFARVIQRAVDLPVYS